MTISIKKIISENQKGFIFILFAALLFFKNTLFHSIIYNLVPISDLWNKTFDFILFWMPKIIPAIFVSSFIFITKKYWWTWIVALLVDLWAISNIVYYESSGFFLTVNEILMAGNLRGFGQSIFTFLHWNQLFFILSTFFYILTLYIIKPQKIKPQYIKFFITLTIIWLLCPYRFFYDNRGDNPYWTNGEKTKFISTLNPFFFISYYVSLIKDPPALWSWTASVMHHSIISYAPMTVADYISWKSNTHDFAPQLDTLQKLNQALVFSNDTIIPSTNLYIILVESFESWTIVENQIEDQTITPNICNFIKDYNCYYFPNTVSQIRYGQSGDGQMILISGLLPITRGTACIRLPGNTYPSIAKHFDNATIVNPCPKSWNQAKMSLQYGFTRKRESIPEDDYAIFNEFCRQTDSSNFCLAITISTHTPFEKGNYTSLHFSKDMPHTLHNYIGSIHYMDSCFGQFLQKFQSDSNLQNSIIVITGDHTIFTQQSIAHFSNYAKKYRQPIPATKGFIPLIIYSPKFNSSHIITDTVYQMDIYPTLLQLTGQQNHTWRGFGVDITNDSIRKNRPFTTEEAYRISDMIINSNYLKQFEKQL